MAGNDKNTKSMQRLNIYNYVNYRLYLNDYYALLKEQTRYFSYRYFSNKAGFSSHNVLKQVINGTRNIALKSIPKFCTALNLTARECEYFKLMVLFNQSSDEVEKNDLFREMARYKHGASAKRISELQYQFYTEWYHSVVREMITVGDFGQDYEAIAKRISPPITAAQVKKSFKLLEEIGLIQKNSEGKWIQNDPIIKTPEEVESLAIRNHNQQMITIARDAIVQFPPYQREISGMTVGISRRSFELIKKKIQNFKDEILSDILSDTAASEAVYQLNFQFFPLVAGDGVSKETIV